MARDLDAHQFSQIEEDPSHFAWINWLYRLQNSPKLDDLEQLLKAQNDAFTRNLLRDYSQFKDGPAALTFLTLVQIYIIQPSSTSPVLKPLDLLPADASFSAALGLLLSSLNSEPHGTLRFW